MLLLYDKNGVATAYLDDGGEHVFLVSGKAVAYLRNDSVYAYSGAYLGWIQNGWLWDPTGRAGLCSDFSVGGPQKPRKKTFPPGGLKQAVPAKAARQPRPSRPARKNEWSERSGADYFRR
jgi:hypothetical protein